MKDYLSQSDLLAPPDGSSNGPCTLYNNHCGLIYQRQCIDRELVVKFKFGPRAPHFYIGGSYLSYSKEPHAPFLSSVLSYEIDKYQFRYASLLSRLFNEAVIKRIPGFTDGESVEKIWTPDNRVVVPINHQQVVCVVDGIPLIRYQFVEPVGIFISKDYGLPKNVLIGYSPVFGDGWYTKIEAIYSMKEVYYGKIL